MNTRHDRLTAAMNAAGSAYYRARRLGLGAVAVALVTIAAGAGVWLSHGDDPPAPGPTYSTAPASSPASAPSAQ